MKSTKKTWRERIDEAKLYSYFTEEDRELANDFATCAIGEKYGEKYGQQYPSDCLQLGMDFFHAINEASTFYTGAEAVKLAEAIYTTIQALPDKFEDVE